VIAALLVPFIGHGTRSDKLCFAQAFASDSKPDAVFGVEQLMLEVDKYQGSYRVEGVVSTVAPAEQMFSLIDIKEFKECGVTTCSPLTLPVHWSGSMPAIKDAVRVAGEVREVKGKLVLEATGLDKIILQ
jgi:hypothetical protein